MEATQVSRAAVAPLRFHIIPLHPQVQEVVVSGDAHEAAAGATGSHNVPATTLVLDTPHQDLGASKHPIITSPLRQDQAAEAWLPITESRQGSACTAAFHLLCSGIGSQALLLPAAFVPLGWLWGTLCLSLVFGWQLYTIWLLVHLHESTTTGTRYSRFLHLSVVAFGQKLGKLLAIFPTMYLSGGTCVTFIIAGAGNMELLFRAACGDEPTCSAKTLKGAEWFLVFVFLAVSVALCFPNLNSLSRMSLLGSVTGVGYCTLVWGLSVSKGRPDSVSYDPPASASSFAARIRGILNGLGVVALAFRGHNVVLEIQGTMPTDVKLPSWKRMWRGVIFSYVLIAMSLFPLAIGGYWAYGNMMPLNGGILNALSAFHRHGTPRFVAVSIYAILVINCISAFQIYAMPVFDNLERVYVTRKKQPCPRWLRSLFKVLFGGLTYFIAVAFPFLGSLGPFIGSITLPLTLSYPCFMWIAIKKPRPNSCMQVLNLGLGSLGVLMSLLLATAALWNLLVVDGLDANFFNPR